MPILLNWFEKQIYVKQNYGPGPILDFFSPLAFQAIYAGYKIKIFDILEKKACSIDELNKQINGNKRCIYVLLDILISLGYLKKINDIYKNTKMTSKWLIKNSSNNLGDMFGFFDDAFDRWRTLDQSILSGHATIKGNE